MFREFLRSQAKPKIQQKRTAENMHIVQSDSPVNAVQDDSVHIVAERPVLVFLPVVAVDANEHAVLIRKCMIYAADRGPIVLDGFPRQEVVITAVTGTGRVRQR